MSKIEYETAWSLLLDVHLVRCSFATAACRSRSSTKLASETGCTRRDRFSIDLISESSDHIAAELEDGRIVVASRPGDRDAHLLSERAAGHHQDPISEEASFVGAMRDEDDRLARLLAKSTGDRSGSVAQ